MFKNKTLQMQIVTADKAVKTTETATAKQTVTLEQISKIAKDHVKHTAVAVIGVYAAVVTIKTASEIAINAAPKSH